MPVCDREEQLRATASHRQLLCLPLFLLMQSIDNTAAITDGDEVPPSAATVKQAKDLMVEVPLLLLGTPSVNSFFGEIHLSWTRNNRQVALIFLPDRPPLVHHYNRAPGLPSTHDIEPASSDRVAYWLRWLRA